MKLATPKQKQTGFTLLEVLIAITITALIGIGSSQLLTMAIQTNEQTQEKLQEFRELQMAVLFIGRDFQQILPRATRDEFGDYKAAVASADDGYAIEFSRVGWRNPMADTRSDIQRVAYELRDGELIRHFWNVLDRAQDSQSVERKLLEDVEEFSIRYKNSAGAWVDEWPPELVSEVTSPIYEHTQLPKAIDVRVASPKFGSINRLFDLPFTHQSIDINQGSGSDSDEDEEESDSEDSNSDNENNAGGEGSQGNEVNNGEGTN